MAKTATILITHLLLLFFLTLPTHSSHPPSPSPSPSHPPSDKSPPHSPAKPPSPSPDTASLPTPPPTSDGAPPSPSPAAADVVVEKPKENGGKKAGVVVGVMIGAAAVGVAGFIYKKRQDNIRRSRYGYTAGNISMV